MNTYCSKHRKYICWPKVPVVLLWQRLDISFFSYYWSFPGEFYFFSRLVKVWD